MQKGIAIETPVVFRRKCAPGHESVWDSQVYQPGMLWSAASLMQSLVRDVKSLAEARCRLCGGSSFYWSQSTVVRPK